MNDKALGDFLRHRRERLRPEDVGLPGGGRRRTPGLRREEVAGLAALSPDYYARLEQGRERTPSAASLASLARAIQLTADEQDYMFAELWSQQYVAALTSAPKLIRHPLVGELDLQCDVVLSPATRSPAHSVPASSRIRRP